MQGRNPSNLWLCLAGIVHAPGMQQGAAASIEKAGAHVPSTFGSAAEALNSHASGSIAPGQPQAIAGAGGQALHRHLACAPPPPMSEAHCRQLVYQHVSWLQLRTRENSGADKGSADIASPPVDTPGLLHSSIRAARVLQTLEF